MGSVIARRINQIMVRTSVWGLIALVLAGCYSVNQRKARMSRLVKIWKP